MYPILSDVKHVSALLGLTDLCSSLKGSAYPLSFLKSHWLRRCTTVVCLFPFFLFVFQIASWNNLHSAPPWFRGKKMGSCKGRKCFIAVSFIILTCFLSTLCPQWNLGGKIFRVRKTDRGQAINWRQLLLIFEVATEKQSTSVLIKAPSRDSVAHSESKVLGAVLNFEFVVVYHWGFFLWRKCTTDIKKNVRNVSVEMSINRFPCISKQAQIKTRL